MFQISRSPFGNFEKIDFENTSTGDGFSVAASPGATLLSLRFAGIECLDGYQNGDDLAAYKWSKSAVLMPFPNRLRDGKYRFEGRDFEFEINNADTQNAIHGLVRDKKFSVSEMKADEKGASLTCRLDDRGRHSSYPFVFRFEVHFSMTATGRFEVVFFCKNKGKIAMPVGFGWHPYFKIGPFSAAEHSLQLLDFQQVMIDKRMLPTGKLEPFSAFSRLKKIGKTRLDNGFRGPDAGYKIALKSPAGKLVLAADGRVWPFEQIFTPPHGESVAIEPMTCNIDALNNGDGLLILKPSESWRGKFALRFSKK